MSFFMYFLERHIENSLKQVDFIQIANQIKEKRSRLRIVIDAESCLDRLYGGYFSNWICSGDWANISTFYRNLIRACFRLNLEVIIYFNGTNPQDNEINEWETKEKTKSQKIAQVFENIKVKKDSQNKLWIKPIDLVNQIIVQLRTDKANKLNKVIQTYTSIKCHQKEIIEFCKINKCEYLFTNDPDILMMILSKSIENINLCSARSFKLEFKGNILAQQYDLNAILRFLNMKSFHIPAFATLLGNRFVNEKNFKKYFESLFVTHEEYLVNIIFKH